MLQRWGTAKSSVWVSIPHAAPGDVVPPGPERHEQLALGVEGEVAVHHRADAHGRDLLAGPPRSRARTSSTRDA